MLKEMQSLTDEDLMKKVKKSNREAAGLLFDRYNKRLYNYFLKQTFDRDVSADLTQNTFLRMLKYKMSYSGERPFKSWIYQIGRNAMNDHFRKKKIYSDYADIDTVVDTSHESDEVQEQTRVLYQSLSKLDPEMRELLVLSKFQRMKYEEIGRMLDLSVSNVKIKVHRAIKKLREHYYQLEKI